MGRLRGGTYWVKAEDALEMLKRVVKHTGLTIENIALGIDKDNQKNVRRLLTRIQSQDNNWYEANIMDKLSNIAHCPHWIHEYEEWECVNKKNIKEDDIVISNKTTWFRLCDHEIWDKTN